VIKSVITAIRPPVLHLDTEESSPGDMAAPITPEASPKIEANNSLSIS
jgi:hypothetical protein